MSTVYIESQPSFSNVNLKKIILRVYNVCDLVLQLSARVEFCKFCNVCKVILKLQMNLICLSLGFHISRCWCWSEFYYICFSFIYTPDLLPYNSFFRFSLSWQRAHGVCDRLAGTAYLSEAPDPTSVFNFCLLCFEFVFRYMDFWDGWQSNNE